MSNLHLQHRVGVRCVILGHAVAVALGVAATAAHADMFDFEDLPSLRATDPQGGYEPLGPNFAYHGFTFSAVHNVAGSQNSWWYVNVPESEQDPPYNWLLEGLPWAVQSGEFAIRSGNDFHNTQSVFAVSRTGGGLWTMDGAWFKPWIDDVPSRVCRRDAGVRLPTADFSRHPHLRRAAGNRDRSASYSDVPRAVRRHRLLHGRLPVHCRTCAVGDWATLPRGTAAPPTTT